MPMDFTTDTEVLRQAAALLVEARDFFNDKLGGLREIVADAADKPFSGGHGKTGAYQGQLDDFNAAFNKVFGEFVEDEAKFVRFLEQVHVRMTDTANLYDQTEAQNAQRLTAIANELDGMAR
jgi:hypothetical protein